MDWLTENWLWILFGAVFLWMHLKMHGGHCGHGAHGGHGGHGGGHGGCGGSYGGHDRPSRDRTTGGGGT